MSHIKSFDKNKTQKSIPSAPYIIETEAGEWKVMPDEVGKTLGEGGTAKVLPLKNNDYLVLKIYTEETLKKHQQYYADKLPTMLEQKPKDIPVTLEGGEKITWSQFAWPVYLVKNEQGKIIGYAMHKLKKDEYLSLEEYFEHDIDNQKDRNQVFQKSIFHRTQVALNLASAILNLHKIGHYFVDMKQENIYIHKEMCTIRLIDCDGFAINNGEHPALQYTINKGYIAPFALQEKLSAKDLSYDRYQSDYCLAHLIFEILNYGIRPFDGVRTETLQQKCDEYIAQNDGNGNTYTYKEQKQLYPYSLPNQHQNLIQPLKYSIHEYFPQDICQLFELAFTQNKEDIPTAKQWVKCLKQHINNINFTKCSRYDDEFHHHFKETDCFACEVFQDKPNGKQQSAEIKAKTELHLSSSSSSSYSQSESVEEERLDNFFRQPENNSPSTKEYTQTVEEKILPESKPITINKKTDTAIQTNENNNSFNFWSSVLAFLPVALVIGGINVYKKMKALEEEQFYRDVAAAQAIQEYKAKQEEWEFLTKSAEPSRSQKIKQGNSSEYEVKVIYTTDDLKLHTLATEESASLGVIPKGSRITPVENPLLSSSAYIDLTGPDWLEISYSGELCMTQNQSDCSDRTESGFIQRNKIAFDMSLNQFEIKKLETPLLTGNNANIRQCFSKSCQAIGIIPDQSQIEPLIDGDGDLVQIKAKNKRWIAVQYSGEFCDHIQERSGDCLVNGSPERTVRGWISASVINDESNYLAKHQNNVEDDYRLYKIGDSYFIVNNNEKAIKWLQKEAEQENADAQYALGNVYANMKGYDAVDTSLKWYEKAGNNGHKLAAHTLGDIYFSGVNSAGIEEDPDKACYWYKKAGTEYGFCRDYKFQE